MALNIGMNMMKTEMKFTKNLQTVMNVGTNMSMIQMD